MFNTQEEPEQRCSGFLFTLNTYYSVGFEEDQFELVVPEKKLHAAVFLFALKDLYSSNSYLKDSAKNWFTTSECKLKYDCYISYDAVKEVLRFNKQVISRIDDIVHSRVPTQIRARFNRVRV